MKNPLVIKVYWKMIYGNDRYYPADEFSKMMAHFLNQTTFNQRDIDMMKSLGYRVELVIHSL